MHIRTLSSLLLVLTLLPDTRAEVVHTTDGRIITGTITADEPADSLLIDTLRGPVSVARDDVLNIEDRVELLKALNVSKRRLAKGDPQAQIQLAQWALRKGLFSSALNLADQALILAQKSRDMPAVELPHSLFEVPVEGVTAFGRLDPESARKLLRAAAGKAPATALVASARLRKLATESNVTDTLVEALSDSSPGVRRAALQVLAVTVPEGTIERVIERMLFDRDRRVRQAATRTVQAYADDGVIYPLVRAIGQDDARLREASLDAIEILKDRRAVGALVRHLRRAGGGGSGKIRNNIGSTTHTSFVRDFDVEIAQAAVIAQPIVGVATHGAVLDVGVAGAFERRVPVAERARVAALLEQLTGEKFGTNAQKWEEWLEQQRP